MRKRVVYLSMATGAAGIAANALSQAPALVWLALVWPVLLVAQFALLWRAVRMASGPVREEAFLVKVPVSDNCARHVCREAKSRFLQVSSKRFFV